ncbi:MAG: DUF4469 domain-containing protein [Treponema sp.]|nr:DUF4469 domain-containing protein [Treponema sp.]
MLDIYVSRNNFENRKKEFTFRSRNCGTITRDQFVQIIAESNTTVTEADTIAVMTLIEQQFDKLINEGFAVQLPMGTFRAGASGTAESQNDSFRPKPPLSPDTPKRDHELSLLFEPDRKKEKNLKYHVKYKKTSNRLVCRPFFDALYTINDSSVHTIEQGQSLSTHGDYLKIDFSDEEQGLYLCKGGGFGCEKLYRISSFSRNARKTLTFTLPWNIPDGDYMLCICTRPAKTLLTAYSRDFRIERQPQKDETSLVSR